MAKQNTARKPALVAVKEPAVNSKGNTIQPSRVGRVLIGGHFLPIVARELKILAIREGKTLAEMLREALTDLFIKRGMPSVDKLESK